MLIVNFLIGSLKKFYNLVWNPEWCHVYEKIAFAANFVCLYLNSREIRVASEFEILNATVIIVLEGVHGWADTWLE